MTQKSMCPLSQWLCPSKFWGIFLVAKQVSFCLLAYGKEISNWENWCFFGNLDPCNGKPDRKGVVVLKENVGLWLELALFRS